MRTNHALCSVTKPPCASRGRCISQSRSYFPWPRKNRDRNAEVVRQPNTVSGSNRSRPPRWKKRNCVMPGKELSVVPAAHSEDEAPIHIYGTRQMAQVIDAYMEFQ